MSIYDEQVDNAIQLLMNYHKLKRELQRYEMRLYIKEHEMYDIKAIQYDKDVHVGGIPRDELILVQMISKDILESQIERLRVETGYLDMLLDYIDEEYKELVRDRFVGCMTMAELEIKYNYSRKQIKRRIKKAVNKSIYSIQTCPNVPEKTC